MSNLTDLRIAWCMPGPDFSKKDGLMYWEPVFAEMQHAYPNTVFITTNKIHPHYKDMFRVRSIGKLRHIKLSSSDSGYSARTFQLLSPQLFLELFRLRPKIIISAAFNAWTLYAVMFKRIMGCRIIVLREGSSPAMDFIDEPVRLMIRRLISKGVDAFITNSFTGEKYLQDIIQARKVYRRPYEVPSNEKLFQNVAKKSPVFEGMHPRFLYVGQLIHRKGVDLLLNAWAKFQDLAQGSLIIVGEGPKKESLVKQAAAMILRNVEFVGKVEYSTLGAWYEACDIFVFPTREDIWGMVLLEAMAFGKPVLCSRCAGSAEFVLAGQNGFLFDPEDQNELAGLMLQLASSPELLERFGSRSEEIMMRHTPASAAAAIQDVIEHVIQL